MTGAWRILWSILLAPSIVASFGGCIRPKGDSGLKTGVGAQGRIRMILPKSRMLKHSPATIL